MLARRRGFPRLIWLNLWPALYGLCVTGLVYVALSHRAYDDPFITYRYAENLARGLGFVYNAGEQVLSTTTPLFAILLALGSKLWPDLPRLAGLLGAAGVALGGWFLWDLARAWKTEWAGWVALALYPTFTLLLSTLGSETPLYLAFCLGALAAYARENLLEAAVFSALAVLTRGDGALVAALLGVHGGMRILRDQKRPEVEWWRPVEIFRAAAAFLLLTLPWFLFAWAYFGQPLPVTLAAKQSQGSMAISRGFGEGFLRLASSYLGSWEYRLEAILAVAGLGFAAARRRPWLLLFAWTALYYLSYTALGVTQYFWYYAPLVPGFVAAVGLGIAGLAALGGNLLRRLPARLPKNSPLAQEHIHSPETARLGAILPLACLLLLALAQVQNVLKFRQYSDGRYEIYRDVGTWLSQHTPATARVGALEVGIIGYYARRSMVDFAGLIQPDVAAHLTPQTTYEDAALWAVERYRPEYLVLHDRLFPRLEAEALARQCRPVRKIAGKPYGYSSDLVIYACPDR